MFRPLGSICLITMCNFSFTHSPPLGRIIPHPGLSGKTRINSASPILYVRPKNTTGLFKR